MHKIHGQGQIRQHQGFSLIELMIVVAIVGILGAIAIPSYSRYVVKSNRAAAEGFITSVASKQQQYMLDARAYAPNMATLGYTSSNIPSEVSNNYNVSITLVVGPPPGYVITATPTGSQLSRDTQCGSVSINQAGTKTQSAGTVADCW